MIDEGVVIEFFTEALIVAMKLAAPLLIISLIVGLIIAILQAATQIHEQTLTFVPKLFTIALVLLFTGPWMYSLIKEFFLYVFQTIATLV